MMNTQKKTNQPTVHTLEGGKAIILPKGLPVEPASNLPSDSRIKYWITSIPSKMMRDPQLSSHFRNIGFGVEPHEIE